jgi:perosamine synthetase
MSFIPVAQPIIGEKEIAYVTDAVRSTWVSSIGPYIDRFERAFADYVRVPHAIAVCNGTAGLHLVLHALGLGPGDEVIVPDLTFVATAHAALLTGATPVFVDVERDTWCMDPAAVRRAITPRTRVIIPVHLYGHPADMGALLPLAQEHGLLVVEDAAEAHGSEVGGQKVSSLGQAGVFSFYGNKVITTGEGGMVTTKDDALASRLRYLKDHGMRPQRRYYHTELAFNYRMTNLQAALGLAQLEQIETFIEQRRKVYQWYAAGLAGLPDVVLNSERPGVRNVYWLASIILTEACRWQREEFMQALRAREIDSRPFFVPMHQLPHLVRFRTVGKHCDACPESERLGARGLSLPTGGHLSEEQVAFICQSIREILH